MSLEERHHRPRQLCEASDAEFLPITVIRGDLPASEELAHLLEDGDVPLVLYHAELWKDLPAYRHAWLPVDADEEATLTVDEPNNPFGTRPFLLVACTGRIVTHR